MIDQILDPYYIHRDIKTSHKDSIKDSQENVGFNVSISLKHVGFQPQEADEVTIME